MRPLPQDKLERLVQDSVSVGGEQGQPIHIGDPGQCPPSFMTVTTALGLWPERRETYRVPELPLLCFCSRIRVGFRDALQVE